jgi:hypothetical protein
MVLPLGFLKQIGIMPQTMHPRYLNVMAVRNLMEKFQENIENYGIGMAASFYHRTAVLQGLCHAKQLLSTQGTGSFKDYFQKLFKPDPKEPKKFAFKK